MTEQEVLRACALRLQGWSWVAISDKLHYAERTIHAQVREKLFGNGKRARGVGRYPLIRKWMQQSGLGAKELAKELGYTARYVYQILNGYDPMPKEMIDKISKMSGLSRDLVLAYEEKKKPSGAKAKPGGTTKNPS